MKPIMKPTFHIECNFVGLFLYDFFVFYVMGHIIIAHLIEEKIDNKNPQFRNI